jgi:aminomethyltransferase
MGRVAVSGRHARRFLERLCTRRISDMTPGQCRYSLVCNPSGGVRDDILVYKLDDDEYLLVVNASNREKLLGHFEQVRLGAVAGLPAGELIVKIEDRTEKTAMVAIQGPKVMDVIAKLSSQIPTLKRYRFVEKNYLILKLLVSRTGYTGEDGVEVILPANVVDMGLKMLLSDLAKKSPDSVVKPAGLGARDTLRMEAAMPLYGHELGEEINALSCGVDFAIAIDKDKDERGEAYVGMEALKKTRDAGGPAHKLVGLFVDGKRTARQGMKIAQDGKEVGVVTSGCLSPTLERCIAMGFVPAGATTPGTRFQIDTGRGQMLDATVTPMPFYKAAK